ncbi:RNase adapter RapZ [Corynebacterium sp. HMSC08A12]|uniref:RapZ C-terminal domain-containing protein n=1 Tax=Corynebacterium sp. HMSC08A12 TaxID=1581134 RepID=UPI0009F386D1
MRIISFSLKTRVRPQAQLTIDTRRIPNPYAIPKLRPLNGTNPQVQNWLLEQPGVQTFINKAETRIRKQQPTVVAIGCTAGQHRSVAIAEILAQRLNAEVEHKNLKTPNKKPTTTQKGLGHIHQTQRRRLLYNHKNGTPCWWCGQPMYKNKNQNWDKRSLEADHSKSRRDHGTNQLADRLLHATCNAQRGAGDKDNQRPALGTTPPPKPKPTTTRFTWTDKK